MAPVFTCEQIAVEASLSRRPRTSDYRITSSHTLINQPTWRQLIQRRCDSCSPLGTIQEEEGPLTPTSKCRRLRIWCKRTTDVRSNMGVYFPSNKCAQRLEVVTAARLFTVTSGDCSDKDELQRHPRSTEEDHRDSVAELKTACQWLSSSSSSSVRKFSSSFCLCDCLRRVSVSLSHHHFSPL